MSDGVPQPHHSLRANASTNPYGADGNFDMIRGVPESHSAVRAAATATASVRLKKKLDVVEGLPQPHHLVMARAKSSRSPLRSDSRRYKSTPRTRSPSHRRPHTSHIESYSQHERRRKEESNSWFVVDDEPVYADTVGRAF